MGFAYSQQPMRVVFGAGRLAALPGEVDQLGLARVLVISTPGGEDRAREVADLLGSRAAGVHPHAVVHVPTEVTDAPAKVLHALATGLGAPGSLAELGLAETDLDRAAELAIEASYPNPRPVTRDGVRELLGTALEGTR